jgi:hypothetical protein
MSGIGQQLPALIGVVIGALASYLAGAATERARWRRERSSRWDEKRAQAYAEYGYAIKNVYVQCMRAAGIRFQGTQGADIDSWDALQDQIMVDRDHFYRAARVDLGIASGDLPRGGPWEATAAGAR